MKGCTHWDGNPVTGMCRKPAVMRRGVTCPNGCWGEGEFDYACLEHSAGLSAASTSGAIRMECNGCRRADLVFYPIQKVTQ